MQPKADFKLLSLKNFFAFRKLDWLLVKSFIGPFILTFFIAIFVLIMQFLWKYIDDLVGKGLSNWILFEFIFYASARLVPMALPLAVLLASIMTFGALGEHMELTAIKSAGISLQRIFKPLIFTVTIISVFAFFFSNNILPLANLKFNSLYHDIREQKPAMLIKEGIFYNEFNGFSLRVEKKDEDGKTLRNIMVYDHSSGMGDDHVITAEKGQLIQDESSMTVTLLLENGKDYKEVNPKEKNEQKYEMYFTQFKSWEKKFDISKFKLTRSDENFFKDVKAMMTLPQLMREVDTLAKEKVDLSNTLHDYLNPYYGFRKEKILTEKNDSVKNTITYQHTNFKSIQQLVSGFNKKDKDVIFQRALSQARNVKNYTDIVSKQIKIKNEAGIELSIEIYKKFTLSIACLVLFFIGAPLGSIIRKGGLGWPLFYAIIFFIIYHVLTMIGEKMADKMVVPTALGMWMATLVLLPIGIFLTYKAANDSKLFDYATYIQFFKRIISAKQRTEMA